MIRLYLEPRANPRSKTSLVLKLLLFDVTEDLTRRRPPLEFLLAAGGGYLAMHLDVFLVARYGDSLLEDAQVRCALVAARLLVSMMRHHHYYCCAEDVPAISITSKAWYTIYGTYSATKDRSINSQHNSNRFIQSMVQNLKIYIPHCHILLFDVVETSYMRRHC